MVKKLKAVRWKPRQQQENLDSTSILAKPCHLCQGCPCTFRYEDFPKLVAQGNIPESLEVAALYGFHGEVGKDAVEMMEFLLEVAAK